MSGNDNNNTENDHNLSLQKSKRRKSIIIHGYIHQQLSNIYFTIPLTIQDLILDYYFFAHLQWKTKNIEFYYTGAFYKPVDSKKRKNFSKSDMKYYSFNNPFTLNIDSYPYLKILDINDYEQQSDHDCGQPEQRKLRIPHCGIVVADYVISSKKYSMFEWEIVIDHIGNSSYIGFIDAPLNEIFPISEMGEIVLGNNAISNQYSIKIMNNFSYVRCYTPDIKGEREIKLQLSKFEEERERPWLQDGDRIRFQIHFGSKTCDVYINDVLHFEQFFKGFGGEIIPAVSNSGEYAIYSLNTITPVL